MVGRSGQREQRTALQGAVAQAPVGAIQTLGGRKRGGMGVSAIRWNRPGGATLFASCSSRLTELGKFESGWKHFSRQLPMSGQVFAQWGHDFWQGTWPELSAAAIMLDLADANAMPAGMATNAMPMASRPRATKQRWSNFLTT
jgi:hypothetical protein